LLLYFLTTAEIVNNLLEQFSDGQVLWTALFPITYAAHIVEEYYGGGGYSAHMLRNHDIDFSRTRFVILQLIGLLLMIAGVILAASLRFPQTMMVILSAIVLGNGTMHTIRSIVKRRYEPGLVTGVAFWIPLGLVTLYLLSAMAPMRMMLSVAIGLAVITLVELIAMQGGKLVNSRTVKSDCSREKEIRSFPSRP
jgi:hypothetical protein